MVYLRDKIFQIKLFNIHILAKLPPFSNHDADRTKNKLIDKDFTEN